MIKRKLVITPYENKILTCMFENAELREVSVVSDQNQILGNIYLAKVIHIVPNLEAAFVDIGNNQKCYLSLSGTDCKLVAGDEVAVQITKEAVKTKDPVADLNLSLRGTYAVVTKGNSKIGISGKMSYERRAFWKREMECYPREFGIIIRTSAENAPVHAVIAEIKALSLRLKEICDHEKHRTCYSLLYQSEPQYLLSIPSDVKNTDYFLEKIITDDMTLFQKMQQYLSEKSPSILESLTYYNDSALSLAKLYSLNTRIQEILSKKVWLKSGGYLVIEPTEAFVSIDVNTGKFTGKKTREETFLKINLEAAREIAIQLRLRNLSGIIIIDFINMELKESSDLLLKAFRSFLTEDPVNTSVLGFTNLNLVEVTRKKIRKPFYEQIREPSNEISEA